MAEVQGLVSDPDKSFGADLRERNAKNVPMALVYLALALGFSFRPLSRVKRRTRRVYTPTVPVTEERAIEDCLVSKFFDNR